MSFLETSLIINRLILEKKLWKFFLFSILVWRLFDDFLQ